ncbi:MAG: hypothetical protein JXR78_01595 [Victivallales bacterium]|nr:hypothetical protein [Victivallales bacterium]
MSKPHKRYRVVHLTLNENEFLLFRRVLNQVIKRSRKDVFSDRYCDLQMVFDKKEFDLLYSGRRKFNKAHEKFNFEFFDED